jgi:phosphatidate phosphatase PAH1
VQIVVVDIDGTITKSDVRGLMATQVLKNLKNHLLDLMYRCHKHTGH